MQKRTCFIKNLWFCVFWYVQKWGFEKWRLHGCCSMIWWWKEWRWYKKLRITEYQQHYNELCPNLELASMKLEPMYIYW